MSTDPNTFWSRAVKMFVVFVLITSGLLFLGGSNLSYNNINAETTRSEGPIVNRSAVDDEGLRFTFKENFETRENILNLTNKGETDVFYDPNWEWLDTAFVIRYPSGYSRETTPISLEIDTYPQSDIFGRASIVCEEENFNSIIHGEEYFKIRIEAYNESGQSESEIWITILNVNDRPKLLPEGGDFYSVIIQEDESHWGVNNDHDPPNMMMGDPNDPFDTLTYSVLSNGSAAQNIQVEIEEDGSNITFTPDPDWSSPYLRSGKRQNGGNNRTWGQFDLRCTDQGGLYYEHTLWVYVMPVNDTPVFKNDEDHYFDEGELVHIEFSASDADPETEQRLVFGTNISGIINEMTGVQLEFQEEYDFDKEDGILEFMTDNSMVGEYPVAAWVDDRYAKDFGPYPDYPTTDHHVYSNFTLHIVNVNDPPRAVMDAPTETFIYNTTWPITFDARRSSDPDVIHGQNLTYKWFRNGELFGEEAKFEAVIEEEGIYNIKLNVSDGEYFDEVLRTIEVEKTRILGEIFKDKDIERSYTDNVSDQLVFVRSQEGDEMRFGGPDSIDISSITAGRGDSKNIYKIKVMFSEKLEFIFTSEKEQEPTLNIYFLKPDFEENRISPAADSIASYDFPVPTSDYRYNRMEFDLRQISVNYYPVEDRTPSIRKLDTGDGVEITLTIADLDRIGVRPDFEIYATAEVRTQIEQSQGNYKIVTSWDSAGIGSRMPEVSDVVVSDDGEQNGGSSLVWIILIVVVFLVLIAVAVVLMLFFVSKGKKDEEQTPPPVRSEQSVDQMVFGAQDQVTAEQMYGSKAQPTGEQAPAEGLPLPQQQSTPPQEGLPSSEAKEK